MRMTNIATPVELRKKAGRVTLTQETNGTWTVRAVATLATLGDRLDYFGAWELIKRKGWTV